MFCHGAELDNIVQLFDTWGSKNDQLICALKWEKTEIYLPPRSGIETLTRTSFPSLSSARSATNRRVIKFILAPLTTATNFLFSILLSHWRVSWHQRWAVGSGVPDCRWDDALGGNSEQKGMRQRTGTPWNFEIRWCEGRTYLRRKNCYVSDNRIT